MYRLLSFSSRSSRIFGAPYGMTRRYFSRHSEKTEEFDVAILGCGPAGFAAASRAFDLGLKTAVIEGGTLGGASIVNGAFSSKNLWSLARDSQLVQSRVKEFKVDYERVRKRVTQNEELLMSRMQKQLTSLKNVTLFRGWGKFHDAHTLQIEFPQEESSRFIRAKNILIATGSKPRELPMYPINGTSMITSDHVSEMKKLPSSLAVIGAGVIGVEFATIFSSMGQTQVHLINAGQTRLLPREDPELGALVEENLAGLGGVQMHHACKILGAQVAEDHVVLDLQRPEGDDRDSSLKVDCALLSVGRIANVDGLQVESAGVELDEKGGIKVIDDHCRTTQPHIYCAGDASVDVGLVNVAEMEGRHAMEIIAGENPTNPVQYDCISSIMFLSPEVAATGLSEIECRARGIPYKVSVYDLQLTNRALTYGSNRRRGFVKLVVTNDDHMRVLGMRAVGAEASSLVETVGLFVVDQRPIRELNHLIHPHPAICEAIQECVRVLLGCSIYKPHCFDNPLLRVGSWTPNESEKSTHTPQIVPIPTYV